MGLNRNLGYLLCTDFQSAVNMIELIAHIHYHSHIQYLHALSSEIMLLCIILNRKRNKSSQTIKNIPDAETMSLLHLSANA